MKRLIYVVSILAILGSLWSCNNDDERLSKAVLASASSLKFEATPGGNSQTIIVYADANWQAEVPDWVTVEPTSGTGETFVTVSVTDNMRGGAIDNPRKATLVFKGGTLASRAEVLINQSGDKYRDVKAYTVSELLTLKDETIVSAKELTVLAVTSLGFIATDNAQSSPAQRFGAATTLEASTDDTPKSSNIYVLNTTAEVQPGDIVSIMGTKSTDAQSLSTVVCDVVTKDSTGGTVTYPDATDITDQIDTYNPASRDFIAVSGILKGNNLTVEDAKYSISITDAPSSLGIAALNGHRVIVKGYFAGFASPVIRIHATEFEDKGVVKMVYFSEDFEWLDPWSVAGGAGDTVGTDDPSAAVPQIKTPKVSIEGQDVTALAAMEAKGYQFLRVTTKTAGECIYLQQNYLKFGKTSYQAGIVLPPISGIPADSKAIFAFDWCPMRQGSGTIDPVNLILIIKNGEQETTLDIDESGWEANHKLEWIHATVDLTGIAITEETEITLRQTQWPATTANRWMLDNIEIYKADN